MSIEEDFQALWDKGIAHGDECEWIDAGAVFCRAATLAYDNHYLEPAARAWETAGESLRRADRPVEALKTLTNALQVSTPENSGMIAVRLAVTASELGDYSLAIALCEEAAKQHPDEAIGAIALDSLAGFLMAKGEIEKLRTVVSRLADVPDALLHGRLFRSAQLARLDGQFEEAKEQLTEAGRFITELGVPVALAGIDGELAEIAELEGDSAYAAELYSSAIARHGKAERRSLVYRMEAARARAMAVAGLDVLPHALDEGLRFAIERGMRILELDLRLARAMVLVKQSPKQANHDINDVIQLADTLQLRLRVGRAQLVAAELTQSPEARGERLRAAEEALVGNRPWYWRARAARDVLKQGTLSDEVRVQFESMGMRKDIERGTRGDNSRS